MLTNRLEMTRPAPLHDDQMGYIFEFVKYEGNAYALVRDSTGDVVWRRRGINILNEDFDVSCFKSMERFIFHYHPDFWTLQLRSKALETE